MYRHEIAAMGYYDRYVALVAELDIVSALSGSAAQLEQLDFAALLQLGDRVYQPGKWTIRDIFQHIADCERIMSYRALRFARQDSTPLPSFDEVAYADNAGAGNRSFDAIIAELKAIRLSTHYLFDSFSAEMLSQKGHCFGQDVSVLALGFIICGHQQHHLNIIRERYLPLL